jgi:hypothetical protein
MSLREKHLAPEAAEEFLAGVDRELEATVNQFAKGEPVSPA